MDVDLFSEETAQDPWPVLERIRAEGPVVYNDRVGTWMVTGDRLNRKILLDPVRFTLEGAIGTQVFGPEAFITIDDKKRHDALRGVWAVAFQRASLESLRPVIARLADRMIDAVEPRLRAGETIDADAELCRNLPAYVIAHMLGVPEEMRPNIVKWSDDIAHAIGLPPNASLDSDPVWLRAKEAKLALRDFLLKQVGHRRNQPGDDLISQIVHSEIGKELSDEAIIANSRQLLFAGNETTAKWLGHSLVTFAQFPDVRAEVVENRALLPQALEEVMRWQPVAMTLPRLIRGGDIEIEGVVVPQGAEMTLLTGAANRDKARYDEPEKFDIHREFKANLGFGFGMHSCIGVTLARLEAEVVISRVLDRFPDFALAGPVEYGHLAVRGPSHLPLALA